MWPGSQFGDGFHGRLARYATIGAKARAYAPGVKVERAELARVVGDEATRQRELREAHRLFIEIGAPLRAEQVARELA